MFCDLGHGLFDNAIEGSCFEEWILVAELLLQELASASCDRHYFSCVHVESLSDIDGIGRLMSCCCVCSKTEAVICIDEGGGRQENKVSCHM